MSHGSGQPRAPTNSACRLNLHITMREPFDSEPGSALPRPLLYTGERIIPGTAPERLFRDHESRYVFAGQYVAGKDVLDVACGTGIGTSYLLRMGAKSCTGLDIDQEAIDYARVVHRACTFVQADATNPALPDGSVDVVVSFETIEHLKEQQKFLANCKRVLRPGGIFIGSTPNRTLSCWGKENPFHFQELTVVEFREMVSSIFTEVQLYAQKNRIYPLYACRKLLAKALDRVYLGDPIRRFLRGKPALATQRVEFMGGSSNLDREIQQCRTQLIFQPTFIIAVARNAIN